MNRWMTLGFLMVLSPVALVGLGCEDGDAQGPSAEVPGSGGHAGEQGESGTAGKGGSAGGGVVEEACYENPKTHFEIINACTDAVKVDKSPELEGLLPDGSLPPLD